MKFSLIATVMLFLTVSASLAQGSSIVPKPVSETLGKGAKVWSQKITIAAQTDESKGIATLLSQALKEKGIDAVIAAKATGKNKIELVIEQQSSLPAEGYALTVNSSGALIKARTGAGLFYGVQSFLQLFNADQQTPIIDINDYPRFAYRGLHLDVGRHMFPPEFIKKYIDLMAKHKFNRFHWHLTEDQGWRIEIKKYPRLTEVGSIRKQTPIGKQTTRTRAQAQYDGKPYGGFYTQDEIKDVVEYARQRYVTIVPEIELPGHSSAALASYPELGCTGGPYEVASSWGVFKDIYCAGKEDTFEFLQNVFDEVIALFPGEYIHIGGDEAPKDRWKECPNCQKRIASLNLKDEHELQRYFVQRIEQYLNSKGKQIIGWDEILEGGLSPNATVMSWRGESGGIAAAQQGHNVIMTPEKWTYLDYAQDTSKSEPLSIGNYTPISKVYSYEPIPENLSTQEAKHILGAQCNVWTEYIKTPSHAEYMVYPRAAALAEVVWSPKEKRDYADFLNRMKTHVTRLKNWNVNYAKHIEKEFPK
jgi:hexosaminidase